MNESPIHRRFVNKVALITASTQGIGFAIAERLAKEGAKVMISSRKQENVTQAVETLMAQGLEAHGLVCHAGKPEDRKVLLEQTIQRFGKVDILVPCAGVSTHYSPLLDTTEEEYDKMMDTNVKSVFFLIQETLPFMKANGGGSIVLLSTFVAYRPSFVTRKGNGIEFYAFTKAALLFLTKALVPQLSANNIRINCIAPGPIDTKFFQGLLDRMKNKDCHDEYDPIQTNPMKRMGTAEECASAVAFLVSDEAPFINGETLVLAGGLDARL